jgi:hypothetical protein
LDELTATFGEPISVYTRAQAIQDGVLHDVSEWASAREMLGGFTVPVAFTAAVWAACKPSRADSVESARGRAHDVLWMARVAANAARGMGVDRWSFSVLLGGRRRHLVAVVDGDGVTIGYPEDF